jgi:hypothetical protein
MKLLDNPIAQENLKKFQLVKKGKSIYLVINGFEYKMTGTKWKLELELNICNEKFNPTWLLTPNQMFNHSIKLIKQQTPQ